MEKEILYKYAEDRDGKIIHINNATECAEYFCPGCKQSFIFKHGKIRQHHFSHKNPSLDCTGEGYLHRTFKKNYCNYWNNIFRTNIF
jgi:competence CoiA-like predicted nuclease